MNNQYSRGCGYNYRRSAQRDMNMTRSGSSGNRMQGPEMGCSIRRSVENRAEESNCMEGRRMEEHSMERPLAMGYVPMQMWSTPLPVCKGLRIGTIFADLHKPFCGRGGLCR